VRSRVRSSGCRRHRTQHAGALSHDPATRLRKFACVQNGWLGAPIGPYPSAYLLQYQTDRATPSIRRRLVLGLAGLAVGLPTNRGYDHRRQAAELLGVRPRNQGPHVRGDGQHARPAGRRYETGGANRRQLSQRLHPVCAGESCSPPGANRNRKFVDSLLEEDGFELLVRGRGEAGCRPFRAPGCVDEPARSERVSRFRAFPASCRSGRR
jgi:hypothetical protein